MPNNSLQYFVQSPDGTEHGPLDREELVRRFREGEFTYRCKVRNPLVNQWKAPEDIAPLKQIAREQRQKEEQQHDERAVSKLKKRISAATPAQGSENMQRVHERNIFTFSPASVPLRILAGLSDLLLVALWAAVVFFLAARFVGRGADPTAAFYAGFALFLIGAEMMVAWPLGFYAQTLGQRFWGIMVVRMKGQPAFLLRSFVFAVCAGLFGWLTPLMGYIVPSRRAIPDMISRTRVVRIRVISSDSWTVAR